MGRLRMKSGWLLSSLSLLALTASAGAQDLYGGRLGSRLGEEVFYSNSGVPIYTDALDPSIHRWYVPPSMFAETGRTQWQSTNFARPEDRYRRYTSQNLEGDYFYDVYGNLATRGWLVYDWRQSQPQISESSVISQVAGRYDSWFNRLVISTDRKGDYAVSILVGEEIAALLTPMTFRKAGFNGVVTSLQAGPYRATGVFSRISDPVLGTGQSSTQNMTNLMAGRLEVDVTDALTFGFNMVNSHNNNGALDTGEGNPLKGYLTPEQLSAGVKTLVVRLTDDSPEDGEGGAVLISDDVEISTTLMREVVVGDTVVRVPRDTVITGSSIGFASIAGLQFLTGEVGSGEGRLVEGFRTADGADAIILNYLLDVPATVTDPVRREQLEAFTLRSLFQTQLGLNSVDASDALAAVKNLRVRMILANDYRVEVTTDRQADKFGVPQFRPVTRASGNIKNRLNQREVVFDYGLPTANTLLGVSAELRDFHGIDLYGEINVNTQFRKYPGIQDSKHRAISGIRGDENSVGWMLNLSWKGEGPLSLFAEGFGMDDAYTTSILPIDRSGNPDYSPEATNLLYEYVDDNDDNDRQPDQLRVGEGSYVPRRGFAENAIASRGVADPDVFPGYDENLDFISDFNQNSTPERPNFFPDYDEPFLRYSSDRPEFLFGIDLNNNSWVERFENDDDPDYPYKKDHFGYNVHGKFELSPEGKLTLGQLREEMGKTRRKNHTSYGMFTYDTDLSGLGRLRVFDMLKKAEDTIPDNLVQWVMQSGQLGQAAGTTGQLERIIDPLAADDTWINTFYTDWQYKSRSNWKTLHRLKWETWRQRDADIVVTLDDAGDTLSVFDPLGSEGRLGRENSGFIGIINKAEYAYDWRILRISPRIKSEFLKQEPFTLTQDKERSWDLLAFLLVDFPLFKQSRIKAGLEQRFFYKLRGDEDDLADGARSGDFRGSAAAIQLTNISDYLGYMVTTQVGFRLDRRSVEIIEGDRDSETAGLGYLTVFAGLR